MDRLKRLVSATWRWLHRVFSSAVTAYVIFAVVIILVISGGQHQNKKTNRKAKEAQDAFNAKICKVAKDSWDERDALVKQFTQHNALPKGVDPESASGQALQQAIDNGNARRDREKTYLLDLQGPRPTC